MLAKPYRFYNLSFYNLFSFVYLDSLHKYNGTRQNINSSFDISIPLLNNLVLQIFERPKNTLDHVLEDTSTSRLFLLSRKAKEESVFEAYERKNLGRMIARIRFEI